MTVQDLNVLVNLAERARKAGLINFDEFAVVSEAVKNAVTQIANNTSKPEEPVQSEPSTKKAAKTAKINE